MSFHQDVAVNDAAMASLIKACPVELGMSAKLIQELVFGPYPVFTVEDVFGMTERTEGCSMFEEYLDKKGYTFSWGTLSEHSGPSDPDDDESLPNLRFEFAPLGLLRVFPQSAQLEDLFMCLYANDPRFDEKFPCEEGFDDLSVISFNSEEGCGDSLRGWMTDVFIPMIWGDLLREATRIVEERIAAAILRSSDGSFKELLVERDRHQLCIDPAKLQFEAYDRIGEM